jgi:RsiW-degrading membrane proteinase PrsW (M82 family)
MEELKKSHLLISTGLGGLIGFLCAWVETFYMIPTLPLFFVTGNFTIITLISACIIAPFVEELSKPMGVYLVKMEEKPLLSVKNWMLLGTFAGLGFGLMENAMYTLNAFSVAGANAGLLLLLLRMLLCLPLHMIATTISCFGFGLWANTGKIKYFIVYLLISMLIHGSYNFIASII